MPKVTKTKTTETLAPEPVITPPESPIPPSPQTLEESFKDSVLRLAREIQELEAKEKLKNELWNKTVYDLKTRLLVGVFEELKTCSNLTVGTNTPFSVTLNLTSLEITCCAGNLKAGPTDLNFVGLDGKLQSFPIDISISDTPEIINDKLLKSKKKILNVYAQEIAKIIRLAKPVSR